MTESETTGQGTRGGPRGETFVPADAVVPIHRWAGPWAPEDPNANFKADVALHSTLDPMATITALAETVGLPVGAVVHYVLSRYATSGSAALLELGPTMVERLWEPVARAEEADDDQARLACYRELKSLLSWLRVPLAGSGGTASLDDQLPEEPEEGKVQ